MLCAGPGALLCGYWPGMRLLQHGGPEKRVSEPLMSNLSHTGCFRGLQSSFRSAHGEHGARPAGGREGCSVPTCGIGVAWPQPQLPALVCPCSLS